MIAVALDNGPDFLKEAVLGARKELLSGGKGMPATSPKIESPRASTGVAEAAKVILFWKQHHFRCFHLVS